jgi:hypothetical protein
MKQQSIVDRVKAYPVVSVLFLIGALAAGVASFTQSIDTIAKFAKTYFFHGKQVEPGPRTSATLSGKVPSGTAFAGNFAGYNWNFLRGRGLVQVLDEKINLSTHRAEALAWIDDKTFADFELSAIFELVSGDTSLGFGPVFWLRDERTFYHFALRTAGDYRLVRYRDGKGQELIPWTYSPKVRRVLTSQAVKIVTVGKRIRMFIEGDAVRDYEVQKGEAGKVGFYAADGGLNVGLLGIHVSGRELN